MVGDYDFVIFLFEEWDICFRRHLIRTMAECLKGQSKLLCVERPVDLAIAPVMHGRKLWTWLQKKNRLRQEKENLFIYTPFIFLHDQLAARVPYMTNANRILLASFLSAKLYELNFRRERLISWVYHPYQVPFLNLVGERFIIYECYDEPSPSSLESKETPKGYLEQMEREVLERADIVFAVSESLRARCTKINPNVFVVPNAVDPQHFGCAQAEETRIPDDIAGIKQPIVGFLGRIDHGRMDYELIKYLAFAHSEWSIVLVGGYKDSRKYQSFQEIERLENVHLLGEKSYEDLPAYLKAFRICIVPFRLNSHNLSCSPLKLYEYLATGKPIVSVEIPHVARLKSIVGVARDATQFDRNIVASLSEDDDSLPQQRVEAALENSWKKRAEQVMILLEQCL